MRMRGTLAAWLIVGVTACGGYSPTSPTSNGGGVGGGTGSGGGYGGGGTGGGTGGGGGTASGDVAVIVGNNFMKSGHNGSINPAVDTVAVGGSVTWTSTSTGSVPHGIQSLGNPVFRNSTVLTGDG